MKTKKNDLTTIDFVEFLEANNIFPKYYFLTKNKNTEIAALGVLKKVLKKDLDNKNFLNNNEIILFIRAFAKRHNFKQHKSQYLYIPSVYILRENKKTSFYNFTNKPNSVYLNFSNKERKKQQTKFLNPSSSPCFLSWQKNIQKFKRSKLKKLVLARKTSFNVENFNPYLYLNKLKEVQNSFVYSFSNKKENMFFGSSPESLYKKQELEFITESLAGTTNEKIKDAKSLLEDPKNLKENSIVKNFLLKKLEKYSKQVSLGDKKIHQLKNLSHIKQEIKAVLKENINIIDLIQNIAPTPALSGYPQKKSLKKIAKFEKFNRGFYGGVLGYFREKESQGCVSIRSLYLNKKTLNIFAGAGIIQESDPLLEWRELNLKIKFLLEILKIESTNEVFDPK